jgi:hypothetical protein
MPSDRDFKRLINGLIGGIRGLVETQGKLIEAIAKQKKGNQEAEEPTPPGPPQGVSHEVHFPPKEVERYHTGQDNTYKLQGRTFWVSLATLVFLIVYTGFTVAMYFANRDAANAAGVAAAAATSAAETAAQQLELSERPWIQIIEARMSGPLTFSKEHAQLAFHFKIKNIGRSPALDTFINLELGGPGTPFQERKRFCEQTTKNTEGLGTALFPDAEDTFDTGFTTTRKDIEARTFHGFLTIYPIACVSYRPSFIDSQYYTGAIYELARLGPPGAGFHVSLRPDQDVPLKELYFATFPASATITGITHNKTAKP